MSKNVFDISQELMSNAQAVARRYIVHIHRLAGDELHRILFCGAAD